MGRKVIIKALIAEGSQRVKLGCLLNKNTSLGR